MQLPAQSGAWRGAGRAEEWGSIPLTPFPYMVAGGGILGCLVQPRVFNPSRLPQPTPKGVFFLSFLNTSRGLPKVLNSNRPVLVTETAVRM